MKKSILTVFLAATSIVSSAQGLKLTEAAVAYGQLSPMWFAQPDLLEPSKTLLKKSKASIDISFAEQEAKKSLKVKDEAKLYYYRGVIYLDYMFLAAFDDVVKKEVEANEKTFSEVPFSSLKKSLELSKYYEDDIKNKINFLRAMSIQGGVKLFEDKDYKNSFDAFKGAVELSDVIGYKDTLAMFNAGMAAENAGNLEDAVTYYTLAADNNYLHNANVYINIIKVLDKKNNGPSDQGYAIIEKAKLKYPGDINLIIEEFNYYNSKGNTEKAQQSLEAAIAKDPKNPIFHYSIGATFDNSATAAHEAGKVEDAKMYFDKAVASYLKAIELDPKMSNAYYNLGVLYNNESFELNKRIQSIKDVKIYNDEKEKSNELLKKAIPYLVKSHELQPNDVNTLKLLKSIYFALDNMEKQYEEIEAKLKALGY